MANFILIFIGVGISALVGFSESLLSRKQKWALLWAFIGGIVVSVAVNRATIVSAQEVEFGDGDIDDDYGDDKENNSRVRPASFARWELAPIVELADNPTNDAKVELGLSLFMDDAMSSTRTIACVSCHDPSRAFTDGRATAVGVGGAVGRRNAPTILNACYKRRLMWDGRLGPFLESQPGFPLLDAGEHGMTQAAIVAHLNGEPEYVEMFAEAFDGDKPSFVNVVKALAAFMRECVSYNAPIDKYLRGETWALKERAKLGLAVFINCSEANGWTTKKKLELTSGPKASQMFRSGFAGSCSSCHNGQDFRDDFDGKLRPHNIGSGEYDVDLGVQIITDDNVGVVSTPETDAYITPTLREIQLTNPYFHAGSMPTIEAVIAFKEMGGYAGRNKSRMVYSYKWTPQERADLAYFLKTAFAGDYKERIERIGVKVKE